MCVCACVCGGASSTHRRPRTLLPVCSLIALWWCARVPVACFFGVFPGVCNARLMISCVCRRVGEPEKNARRTQTAFRGTRAPSQEQRRDQSFAVTAATATATVVVVVVDFFLFVARRVAAGRERRSRSRRADGRQTVRTVQSFAVRVVSIIQLSLS